MFRVRGGEQGTARAVYRNLPVQAGTATHRGTPPRSVYEYEPPACSGNVKTQQTTGRRTCVDTGARPAPPPEAKRHRYRTSGGPGGHDACPPTTNPEPPAPGLAYV